MDIHNQKLGIWGFGIVGKSAAQFLHQIGSSIDIIDNRVLTQQEQELAGRLGTWQQATTSDDIENFLTRNDAILVSPGIDTRPFASHGRKFIAELDLFHAFYTKPIIAITGSVGKTTVTTLISHLINTLQPGWWTGGNIGTGMLDALSAQDATCGAILEVSSFQLELCSTFAPDLAIITNIFPNHLDRHGSFEQYIQAKARVIYGQKDSQQALVPLEYRQIAQSHENCHYFSMQQPTENNLLTLPQSSHLFFYKDEFMYSYHNGKSTPIINIDQLPQITFIINWLIVCSALYLQGFQLDTLGAIAHMCQLPAHRLELVDTINGVDFYNDSKGTTIAATLAAVHKLKTKPIILLLGGMGKGVDREPLIRDVKPYVKTIICFGKEHEQLSLKCQMHHITHSSTEHLETALQLAFDQATQDDQIVLSPAGTSFDEFKNYEDRGNFFKEQVKKIRNTFIVAQ